MLEHLSEGRIPAGDGFHLASELTRLANFFPYFHSDFEEFELPSTGMRKRLFAMLPANDVGSQLASQCLIAIEEHRDEKGQINDEPWHPDIASMVAGGRNSIRVTRLVNPTI